MVHISLFKICLGLLAFPGPISGVLATQNQKFCTPQVVTSWEQQEIFQNVVEQLYIRKNAPKAFESIQENYIQHNPYVGQGAATALGFLRHIFDQVNVTVYHAAFDSGTGYVHFRAQGPPNSLFPVETAVMDIYRMNGSCIAEHWDVIQAKPANATNPLALF